MFKLPIRHCECALLLSVVVVIFKLPLFSHSPRMYHTYDHILFLVLKNTRPSAPIFWQALMMVMTVAFSGRTQEGSRLFPNTAVLSSFPLNLITTRILSSFDRLLRGMTQIAYTASEVWILHGHCLLALTASERPRLLILLFRPLLFA